MISPDHSEAQVREQLREALAKALAKATPGPWHVDVDEREDGADQVCYAEGARSLTLAFMSSGRECTDGEFPDPDAELICLLRNHADLLLAALSSPQGAPPRREVVGVHRCKVCGTRWLLWPDVPPVGPLWNLLDQHQRPGSCCDNAPMGDQIEHLRDILLASPSPRKETDRTPEDDLADAVWDPNRSGNSIQQAIDAYRAALSSPHGARPTWQPISTAPKGGGAEDTRDPKWVEPPRILAFSPSRGLVITYWDWYYAEGGSGYRPNYSGWVNTEESRAFADSEAPTHWMPLPDPPLPVLPHERQEK